jgi:formiminotetrahydrofolate cyclodeaminase
VSTSPNWTISDLAETVADPDKYAGGGAIAAMSLAGAAATTELVLVLTKKRKGLDEETKNHLQETLERTRGLRARFLASINEDIRILTDLMNALRGQRQVKKLEDSDATERARSHLDRALTQAIDSPVVVARMGVELLDSILVCQDNARTFTMSDLGAAAATAAGAITSMLFMADVNIDMHRNDAYRRQKREEIDEIRERAKHLSDRIVDRTWSEIRPDTRQGEP